MTEAATSKSMSSRITNLNFRILWIITNIASVVIVFFAFLNGDDIFVYLEFIPIILILLQKGENHDLKYVNSMKFYAVLLNFVCTIFVFAFTGSANLGIDIVIFVVFYAIAGFSLNVSTGLVGVLNFGVIAQIAIGATTYGILTVNSDWPLFAAAVMGMLVPAVFSGVIALVTLRLKDDYFAIISITLGEIFRQILKTEPSMRGPSIEGATPTTPGILNIPSPLRREYADFMPDELLDTFTYRFFLAMIGIAMVIIVFIIVTRIIYSPYGRLLRTIREDELVTSTYGKNVLRYKVEAMTLSGALAGLAGVYLTWIFGSTFPENFLPFETFFIWTVFIIGGRGSNKGIIVGAIAYVLLYRMSLRFDNQEWPPIRILNDLIHFFNPDNAPNTVSMSFLQLMMVGLVLILFVRFAPQGIIPEEPYKPMIGGIELPPPGSQAVNPKIESEVKS